MERFYAELTPFDRFTEFADVGAYEPMPDDWLVLCADVRGSTRAIEAGRYKDVNLIGAACITAVLNVSGDIEVPFVFGGDGAVIVVPPSLREVAEVELVALQKMALSKFQLDLRVGVVPVQDLRQRKAEVSVRKYQLSAGNFLAMFTGGGIELAEKLLKSDSNDNQYILTPDSGAASPSLEGLSCRWEPLAPRGGVMMTMMVKAISANAAQEQQLMGEVLDALSKILGTGTRQASPASPGSMKFRWPPRNAWKEALLTAEKGSVIASYLAVLLTSLVQVLCHALGKKVGDYDGKTYTDELRANTDYRKYDDMLRMVLDVTETQANAIDSYLSQRFDAGDVVFGTHRAKSALMTCVVFSLKQSEHVHFVDGAEGGFAMAAVDLKRRQLQKNPD
jgi:Protein of unknown function (DUF3095)